MAYRNTLMIVRAGDRSLHRNWIDGDPNRRNFDLHVSYYGDNIASVADSPSDVSVSFEKGPKFKGIAACLLKFGGKLDAYDYVGFPDDDILADQATWQRFVDIISEHKPSVAQPALTRDSFWSHDIVLQRRRFLLRWTDMVEVMTPFLSAEALTVMSSEFELNESGWGLDWLWSHHYGLAGRMCVVDATPVLHTRAVGTGPLYREISSRSGGTAWSELDEFIEKEGIHHPSHRTLRALRHNGAVADLRSGLRPLLLPRLRRRYREAVGRHRVGM